MSTLASIESRVALVTGGGQGIGAVIAQHFAAAGATVVVHYRDSHDGAESVQAAITADGGSATIFGADLTRSEQVRTLVEHAIASHGRLDVVVNNAGSYPLSPLLELAEDAWRAVVDANLTTVHLVTREAGRAMAATGDGGAIVNIASIEGVVPAPMHAHYAAAKAGVLMHTRAAAQELGPLGIRVNAVSPGLIEREGLEAAWPEGVERWRQAAPLGRLGRAEDVAAACLFLASAEAGWITGVNLPVDGGVLSRPVF